MKRWVWATHFLHSKYGGLSLKKHSTFYNFRRGSLGLYVGSGAAKDEAIEKFKGKECPVECRPADHKDWIYC